MLSKYFAWEDSFMMSSLNTVVEDYWNCLISQNCERSEQRFHLYKRVLFGKMPKEEGNCTAKRHL